MANGPQKPLRKCKHPSCNELVRTTFCEAHRRQKSRAKEYDRASPSARGYDSQWRKVRKMALKRDHYLCRKCGQPGNEVDHITPISQGGARLDLDNLQTLCKPCHSHKTVTEDGGFGNG